MYDNVKIVIPARLQSTRLPFKLILNKTGKLLLEHTWEAAKRTQYPVQIATDSLLIFRHFRDLDADVVMTSDKHVNGTQRVIEACSRDKDIDLVVNWQGDEPDITAEMIEGVLNILRSDVDAHMATIACPITNDIDYQSASCVKVVCSNNRALYFSRRPIPYQQIFTSALRHIGIYAYRANFLNIINTLPDSELEHLENLEQLKFMQAGANIGIYKHPLVIPRGIDLQEDYDRFVDSVMLE